jgi:hypothetical protein
MLAVGCLGEGWRGAVRVFELGEGVGCACVWLCVRRGCEVAAFTEERVKSGLQKKTPPFFHTDRTSFKLFLWAFSSFELHFFCDQLLDASLARVCWQDG